MKIIGIWHFLAASSGCKSSPLNPRSLTSSTRQLGASAGSCCRAVSADSNVSTCRPTALMRNFSEERTDGSSSTTNTTPLGITDSPGNGQGERKDRAVGKVRLGPEATGMTLDQ